MMMATHDMRLTAEFEQIVVLEKGWLLVKGSTKIFLRHVHCTKSYGQWIRNYQGPKKSVP